MSDERIGWLGIAIGLAVLTYTLAGCTSVPYTKVVDPDTGVELHILRDEHYFSSGHAMAFPVDPRHMLDSKTTALTNTPPATAQINPVTAVTTAATLAAPYVPKP